MTEGYSKDYPEEGPKPHWYDRMRPKFGAEQIGDAFYFGRGFMYLFEGTYDVLRQKLSELKFIQESAIKFRKSVKDFIGREKITVEVFEKPPLMEIVQRPPDPNNLNKAGKPRGGKYEIVLRAPTEEPVRVKLKPSATNPKGLEMELAHLETTTQVREVIAHNNWRWKVFRHFPFVRDIRGMHKLRDGATPGDLNSTRTYTGEARKVQPFDAKGESYYFAANLLNVFEALVFGACDFIGYRSSKQHMVHDLSDTIALDRRKPKSNVSMRDLRDSHNPFIQSEVSQHNWKYRMRFVGDAAFVWGLRVGLVLKLVPYPLEYGMLREGTALNTIRKSLHDMQVNQLGADVEPQLAMDIQRSVEQCLREHKRPLMVGEELKQYRRDVINPMAHMAVNHKLSLGEMVYILGDVTAPKSRLPRGRKKLETLAEKRGISLEAPNEEANAPERDAPQHAVSAMSDKPREALLLRGPQTPLDKAKPSSDEVGPTAAR